MKSLFSISSISAVSVITSISLLISTSALFANEPIGESNTELQVIPVVLSFDGVGDIFGAAVGLTNIGDKDFDIHVGASGGDVKAGLFSLSNYRVGKGSINYQFASVSELNLVTQYSRSTQAGLAFQQELSGSGHHLGYQRPLNKEWAFQTDLLLSTVSFESFRDLQGNKININLDDITDVNSTVVSTAFNWDNREAKVFSAGSQIRNSLSLTTGRDGQADQGQWNFVVSQHIKLSQDVLASAYVKGSHAFILSEIAEYDTDAEIRAKLDAQCAAADAQCLALEDSLVSFILASNTNGTANAVGGSSGLRSYSEQFFRGANSLLEGIEMEYRLPSFAMFQNDKRLHLVAFAESAQVNDKISDLFDDSLHTVGLGLRTYSDGLAVKLETAHGEDGNSWALSVGLPY